MKQVKALLLLLINGILVEKDEKTMQKMEKEIKAQFKYLDYARIVFVSAKTSQRVHKHFPIN